MHYGGAVQLFIATIWTCTAELVTIKLFRVQVRSPLPGIRPQDDRHTQTADIFEIHI